MSRHMGLQETCLLKTLPAKDEVNHDKSPDDLVDDVAIFLHPFLHEVRGDIFNELMLEEALGFIPTVDFKFVQCCLDEIGAPKSWRGQKAHDELLRWVELSDVTRPLAFKTALQFIMIAKECGIRNIDSSLTKSEYRNKLVAALNGDGDNYDNNEEKVLEFELMKSVMSTSFLKPRNKGSGEGQSKYALLGQRMEGPVLKAFFEWCTAVTT